MSYDIRQPAEPAAKLPNRLLQPEFQAAGSTQQAQCRSSHGRPDSTCAQLPLQRISRKTVETFVNACRAEGCLRRAAQLRQWNFIPTLPTNAAGPLHSMTKRQNILTARTGPIDLKTSVYESHVSPPVLMVTLSRPAYRSDMTGTSGKDKHCVNRKGWN